MSTARATFNDELAHLEESLEVESQLVQRSIRGATEAVVSQDVELAGEVIAFDDDIDQSCFGVQHQVELLLARTLTSVAAKPISAVMTRTVSAAGMDWGLLAAAGVLTIIPGALVIWFVRNYIARGFALGRV